MESPVDFFHASSEASAYSASILALFDNICCDCARRMLGSISSRFEI